MRAGQQRLVHRPLRLIELGVSGLHVVQVRQLPLWLPNRRQSAAARCPRTGFPIERASQRVGSRRVGGNGMSPNDDKRLDFSRCSRNSLRREENQLVTALTDGMHRGGLWPRPPGQPLQVAGEGPHHQRVHFGPKVEDPETPCRLGHGAERRVPGEAGVGNPAGAGHRPATQRGHIRQRTLTPDEEVQRDQRRLPCLHEHLRHRQFAVEPHPAPARRRSPAGRTARPGPS
jgi:hypothetical protein